VKRIEGKDKKAGGKSKETQAGKPASWQMFVTVYS
jgi:hypothetical protein